MKSIRATPVHLSSLHKSMLIVNQHSFTFYLSFPMPPFKSNFYRSKGFLSIKSKKPEIVTMFVLRPFSFWRTTSTLTMDFGKAQSILS